ncbi:MAG: hypothetical protein SH850_21685 [Planctomycetaceae bacterium]|nr:hypothetical protein [Planctomycetaceae bacterium]
MCLVVLTVAVDCRGDEAVEAAPLPPPPFEFQPYRVECAIAADPDAPAVAGIAAQLTHDLPQWVTRTIGERWRFTATTGDRPAWATHGQLARLPAAAFDPAMPVDVLYYAVVRRQGNRLLVDLRASEPLFGHLSPVRTASCLDPRELAATVAAEMPELFRPRAYWERVNDYTVRLRVQAGALADGEHARPIVREREVFVPWIVFRNRERQVQRVQELPWTFLSLEQIDDGRGTGRVVSGLRNPLGARPRGRVELLAVAVRSQWTETAVHVVALSQPPRPLPAHHLELTPMVFAEEGIEPPPPPPGRALLTDRDGIVRLPRGEAPQLQWLRVMSGDLLLAKVPVLPGATPSARLELPDDSLRLQVEGQLKLLQGDVVSVVAQRAALMATARSSAKKRQWDDAKLRLRQIDVLPQPQSFKERISSIRGAADVARQSRDRVTEQRIIRLCDETVELVQHYLNDEKIKLLKEEIAELETALKEE